MINSASKDKECILLRWLLCFEGFYEALRLRPQISEIADYNNVKEKNNKERKRKNFLETILLFFLLLLRFSSLLFFFSFLVLLLLFFLSLVSVSDTLL